MACTKPFTSFPLLSMAFAVFAALAALRPPPAASPQASPDAFASARALPHVRAIAREPRPMGSAANAVARAYVVDAARAAGLEVDTQEAASCTELAGMTRCGHVTNVVARLRGTAPAEGGAIMLAAHYDSVPSGPGASDDGVGVATLLEAGRALAAGERPRHDVVFLFTDGEEEALLGAAAFVRSAHPWRAHVRVALNFEARGTRGPSAMYDVPAEAGDLVSALGSSAPHVTATSLMTTISRVLPNGADSFAFATANIPTMSFAFVDGYERYHRMTDSVDNVDERCLQHHGEYAVALARRLGNAAIIPTAGGELVSFDVIGRFLVRYPAWLARMLGVLTLAAFVGLARRGWRAREPDVAGGASALGRGAAFYLAGIAIAGVATAVLVAAEGALVPPHLLSANGRWFVPAHAAAVIGATLWARARMRRTGNGADLGPLVVWAVVGALLGLVAPGASFVVQLPLACLLAARALARRPLAAAAVCAPAALLLAQAAGATFLALGPDHPAVPALLLAWALGGLASALPIDARLAPRAPMRRTLLAWSTGSILLALGGALAARADRITPRPDSLLYVVDAATGDARWVSFSSAKDEFTSAALGNAPVRGRPSTIDPEDIDAWQAAAPSSSAKLPAADVTIVGDDVRDGRRHLTLLLRSAPGTRELTLFAPHAARPRALHLDGVDPLPLVRFGRDLDARLFRLFGGPAAAGVSLSILAPSVDGVRLELDVDVAPIELTVVRKTPGFAISPPAERPAGFIRSGWSDETWVTSTTRL